MNNLLPSLPGKGQRQGPTEKTETVTVGADSYQVTVSRFRAGLPTTEKITKNGRPVHTMEEKKSLPSEVLSLKQKLEGQV